jgi:hypothetical protein
MFAHHNHDNFHRHMNHSPITNAKNRNLASWPSTSAAPRRAPASAACTGACRASHDAGQGTTHDDHPHRSRVSTGLGLCTLTRLGPAPLHQGRPHRCCILMCLHLRKKREGGRI